MKDGKTRKQTDRENTLDEERTLHLGGRAENHGQNNIPRPRLTTVGKSTPMLHRKF